MKKTDSYTIVKCTYEFEYIKESFNQFLASLSQEIKTRLGENVQLTAEIKDYKLCINSNNKKVSIICAVKHIMYACVEYRYQDKVCDYVNITFGA